MVRQPETAGERKLSLRVVLVLFLALIATLIWTGFLGWLVIKLVLGLLTQN